MKNTMKKSMLLVAFLITAIMCLAFSAGASGNAQDLAATGQCGNNVFWNYNQETDELVISGSGAMANYYPYRKSPFCESNITAVVIEKGVTSIGSYAFSGCSELKKVTISDTVAAINEKAFEGCYITEVYAANAESWLKIDFDYGYDSDEECIYTSNPLYYGASLFFGDKYVTQVDVPVTITEIKPAAFYNYQGLKVVSIPETVKTIGDGAFWNCRNLEGVVMSEGVTSIGEAAFYSCDGIEEITLPGSVTRIADEAFSECDKLVRVVIADGTKSIGRKAFAGCCNLISVEISKTVTDIYAEAFAGSVNIERVYAADINSWLKINFALYSVGDLYNFSSNPLFYGANLYFNGVLVTNLEIPSGVTEIKPGAFCDCLSMKTVHIPASVKVIGESAFGVSVSGISEVYYGGSAAQWKNIKIGSNNDALIKSTIRFADTALGKTEKITATQNTNTIKLTWTDVEGADAYKVYQLIGGKWTAIGNVTKATATIQKLNPGTKYTFAVKAGKIENGAVTWADGYTTINTATKAAKPAKVASAQNTSAIKLTWNKVTGATGYRIYYKSGSTWKVSVSSITATSHTYKNLKAGAKYTFAIRPYILVDGVVIWSDFVEYTAATTPATVTAKATSSASGKISLSWNQVSGANGYQIYYKTGNGAYKLYKTVNASTKSLNFSNLKSGTKYTFAVRAGITTSGGNIFGAYKEAAVTVK